MDSNFWRDKKIFLTGHTGFKGAWMCLVLKRLGAKIYGYSIDVPTNPSLYEVLNVKALLQKDIRGDICNTKLLGEEIKKSEADIVIHMAAQSLVRKSYSLPIETYQTNVMGTLCVLEAVRGISSIKACLIVTTDKCYENIESLYAYKEEDRLGGHDLYSSSKACAEIVTKSYRNSFLSDKNIRVSTVRAGNVIGGGDWAEDRIVTDIFTAISNQRDLILRNPNAIRPWQHVLDPVLAYLEIVEANYKNTLASESFNVGPDSDSEKNVGWLASEFYKNWDREFKWKQDQNKNPHEAHFLKLDNSKIKSILGWKPKILIQQAIEMTASWYETYQRRRENIMNKTNQQIDSVLERN